MGGVNLGGSRSSFLSNIYDPSDKLFPKERKDSLGMLLIPREVMSIHLDVIFKSLSSSQLVAIYTVHILIIHRKQALHFHCRQTFQWSTSLFYFFCSYRFSFPIPPELCCGSWLWNQVLQHSPSLPPAQAHIHMILFALRFDPRVRQRCFHISIFLTEAMMIYKLIPPEGR